RIKRKAAVLGLRPWELYETGAIAAGRAQRAGFKRWWAEVYLGKVGAVTAREVSRFAKSGTPSGAVWQNAFSLVERRMPTLAENKSVWDASYDWGCAGEEWSEAWGSPQAQWAGCLYPRIFPFLKGRILEIAPGHGRWTQFLRDHCMSLIGVDLAATCVSECRSKFKSDPRLHFEVGDGRKLPMVGDASIDFAFSFDSLVHAEADILESYASELARVLKPNGIAFLHHSNLATLTERSIWDKLKRRWSSVPINHSWRA